MAIKKRAGSWVDCEKAGTDIIGVQYLTSETVTRVEDYIHDGKQDEMRRTLCRNWALMRRIYDCRFASHPMLL